MGETTEFNVGVNVDKHKTHIMRDNRTISLSVCLFPYHPIEQCRQYRRIGKGLNPRQKTRALNAVCFHGHKAFMQALFQNIPKARIRSLMTDRVRTKWMDAENFKQVAQDIESVNVGSLMESTVYSETCECGRV